ncbi:MAG: tusA 3 [Paenibacillus sp.]|nr:tusA 3 [Paenibacillus sp.]
MMSDKLLDATGLACPMPSVKTKKSIEELSSGQVLEVHATDKGSQNDFAAWAKKTGHEILDSKEESGIYKFWIRKA